MSVCISATQAATLHMSLVVAAAEAADHKSNGDPVVTSKEEVGTNITAHSASAALLPDQSTATKSQVRTSQSSVVPSAVSRVLPALHLTVFDSFLIDLHGGLCLSCVHVCQ